MTHIFNGKEGPSAYREREVSTDPYTDPYMDPYMDGPSAYRERGEEEEPYIISIVIHKARLRVELSASIQV